MQPLAPIDCTGRALSVGDWVRLVAVPPSVANAPRDTRRVFRLALKNTFRIESFNEFGLAELDLSRKVARLHFIWVEPEYLKRSRRGQRASVGAATRAPRGQGGDQSDRSKREPS